MQFLVPEIGRPPLGAWRVDIRDKKKDPGTGRGARVSAGGGGWGDAAGNKQPTTRADSCSNQARIPSSGPEMVGVIDTRTTAVNGARTAPAG